MILIACLLLLLGWSPTALFCAERSAGRTVEPSSTKPAPLATTRNLFTELLGKSSAEIDAKLDAAWKHFFAGNDEQRIYFPVGNDRAYIADIGNNDVRSEGMSYGLMIAVQLDRQAEFDRLWQWTVTHMRHADGPRQGYFAWHCKFSGEKLDEGSASDGEEWFAMALLFASHRWGDRGAVNYGAEAQALLREMLHKPGTPEVTTIFNRQQMQVTFVPNPDGSKFTDPSYHLPAFYELWARWAENPGDRRIWSGTADISRAFFHKAAHPTTGLMPDYSHFDGRPHTSFAADKGDFRYDAWRTLGNVALDYVWWKSDPWQIDQSNRVLRFLGAQGDKLVNQYTLDGKPLSENSSLGLVAMAAVAGQASDAALAKPFVQQLWDAPLPEGKWRYYNGVLYYLALLQTSGRFRAY